MTDPLKAVSNADSPKSTFDNRYPVFRHLSGECFNYQHPLTDSERLTLTDVRSGLESELTTMTMGLSCIGKLMVYADSQEVGMEEFQSLGWFLNYLGKQMNEHAALTGRSEDILGRYQG